MEMALELSPNLRSKLMASREDYYLFSRFIRSLSGNCLAINIFASYLEELPSFSVKEFVVTAWTANLHKKHQDLLDRISQSSLRFNLLALDAIGSPERSGLYTCWSAAVNM